MSNKKLSKSRTAAGPQFAIQACKHDLAEATQKAQERLIELYGEDAVTIFNEMRSVEAGSLSYLTDEYASYNDQQRLYTHLKV